MPIAWESSLQHPGLGVRPGFSGARPAPAAVGAALRAGLHVTPPRAASSHRNGSLVLVEPGPGFWAPPASHVGVRTGPGAAVDRLPLVLSLLLSARPPGAPCLGRALGIIPARLQGFFCWSALPQAMQPLTWGSWHRRPYFQRRRLGTLVPGRRSSAQRARVSRHLGPLARALFRLGLLGSGHSVARLQGFHEHFLFCLGSTPSGALGFLLVLQSGGITD